MCFKTNRYLDCTFNFKSFHNVNVSIVAKNDIAL